MTGRSVHDALLRVLSDGTLRARLLQGLESPDNLWAAEWPVLVRLSRQRLIRMSRFLARHYYRERIVRLFRYIRALVPYTGRDPLAVLQMPQASLIMEQATLGSAASAEYLLALIESYLVEGDGAIVARIPYWKDLVRYQSAMFRVEARAERAVKRSRSPRRSAGALIVDFEWDLPTVMTHLRRATISPPKVDPMPISLLIACSRHGRITAVRCSEETRRLVEAADGKRDLGELSIIGKLPAQHVERLLRRMEKMGAIDWNAAE